MLLLPSAVRLFLKKILTVSISNFFQEHYQSAKLFGTFGSVCKQFGLRSDQDQHAGPDLSPNCLQRLSADDKSWCKEGTS